MTYLPFPTHLSIYILHINVNLIRSCYCFILLHKLFFKILYNGIDKLVICLTLFKGLDIAQHYLSFSPTDASMAWQCNQPSGNGTHLHTLQEPTMEKYSYNPHSVTCSYSWRLQWFPAIDNWWSNGYVGN